MIGISRQRAACIADRRRITRERKALTNERIRHVNRLKALRGLTPYEYICKTWANEPERFTLKPHHQMPGLNTLPVAPATR